MVKLWFNNLWIAVVFVQALSQDATYGKIKEDEKKHNCLWKLKKQLVERLLVLKLYVC